MLSNFAQFLLRKFTEMMRSPSFSLLSREAAESSLILEMNMPGSPGICWSSVPPTMLKPNPAFFNFKIENTGKQYDS